MKRIAPRAILSLLLGTTGLASELGCPSWARARTARANTVAWPHGCSRCVTRAYGTDWLAFGHFVMAIAFIGPWRDPVKNIWVIEFGMIACVLVVPFALMMGGVRGIPFGWRLIDCSLGIVGIIPLWFCRKYSREMARVQSQA